MNLSDRVIVTVLGDEPTNKQISPAFIENWIKKGLNGEQSKPTTLLTANEQTTPTIAAPPAVFIEPDKYKRVQKRNNSLADLMQSVVNPKAVNRAYTRPWYSYSTNLTYATDGLRIVYCYGNPFGLNPDSEDEYIIRTLETRIAQFIDSLKNITKAAKIPDLLQYKISAKTPNRNSIEWGKSPLVAYLDVNVSRYFDLRIIKPFSNWYYHNLSNDSIEPDSVQADIPYCHNGKEYRPRGGVMAVNVNPESADIPLIDNSVIAFID